MAPQANWLHEVLYQHMYVDEHIRAEAQNCISRGVHTNDDTSSITGWCWRLLQKGWFFVCRSYKKSGFVCLLVAFGYVVGRIS